MARKKWIAVIIGVVLIGSAVIGWQSRSHQQGMQWVAVEHGKVIDAVYGLATVRSDRVFNVRTGALRQVAEINVELGDYVTKGQALVKFHDGFVVTAPFEGVITDKSANPYELSGLQNDLLTLTSMQDYYLEISLDQDSILKVRNKMPVRLSFDALDGQSFKGDVIALYSNDNGFFAKVKLQQNLPEQVLPGMTANTAIELGQVDNAQIIPLNALNSDGKITYRDGSGEHTVKAVLGSSFDNSIQLIAPVLPSDAEIKLEQM